MSGRTGPTQPPGVTLHILFVCTGNICRSPTAERLAAAYFAEQEVNWITTSSAGIRAVIGSPIHPKAALVLESLGGDASSFAARQLTPRIASSADLVLTMTGDHRDAVLERAPTLMRRTFTMSELAWLATNGGAETMRDLPALRARVPWGRLTDIADPMGQKTGVFQEIGNQIADLLPPIVGLCRSFV